MTTTAHIAITDHGDVTIESGTDEHTDHNSHRGYAVYRTEESAR